jgi:hypothetical protein
VQAVRNLQCKPEALDASQQDEQQAQRLWEELSRLARQPQQAPH